MAQKFKKELWLEAANAQIRDHILSEEEVAASYNSWVKNLDGKTKEEIGDQNLNPDWFE